jgi:hypothetical protein
MSFLTKSIEKRIQELRASIEAQSTELAAYEQVLALESGKPAEAVIPSAAAPARAAAAATHKLAPVTSSDNPITVEFNGSRADFVGEVLKQRGSAGVAPSEISAAFATRKVLISKNLVYNVLSSLFKQKRVRKSAGRYYLVAGAAAKAPLKTPAKAPGKAAAKAPGKAAAKTHTPTPASKKRRISEEGMRRIIAATKKRWALQRAATAKGR